MLSTPFPPTPQKRESCFAYFIVQIVKYQFGYLTINYTYGKKNMLYLF